jgi:hypothetical protein
MIKLYKSIMSILNGVFFSPDYFYCELSVGDGISFKIWERPGLWASSEELNKISKEIYEVSVSGQNGKNIPEYGVLSGDIEDLKNRVITIGYDNKTGKPIGYAAQIYFDLTLGMNEVVVLHLGLVFVSKSFQKKAILSLLYVLPNILLLLKRGFRPLWISSVTQVPAIVGVVGDYYENVYPNPLSNNEQSVMHKSIGRAIMKDYRKSFGTGEDAVYDEEKQLILNSYTGGSDNLKKSFDETPKYRKEIINDYCKKFLDYNRGDDILQIGILSSSLIHRFFTNKLQGISYIRYGLYLSIVAIFLTFLPVLRWLTRKQE